MKHKVILIACAIILLTGCNSHSNTDYLNVSELYQLKDSDEIINDENDPSYEVIDKVKGTIHITDDEITLESGDKSIPCSLHEGIAYQFLTENKIKDGDYVYCSAKVYQENGEYTLVLMEINK